MVTLEKLDKMKTELYTAKQALHEADNWTVLASDIEEVCISFVLGFTIFFLIYLCFIFYFLGF